MFDWLTRWFYRRQTRKHFAILWELDTVSRKSAALTISKSIEPLHDSPDIVADAEKMMISAMHERHATIARGARSEEDIFWLIAAMKETYGTAVLRGAKGKKAWHRLSAYINSELSKILSSD